MGAADRLNRVIASVPVNRKTAEAMSGGSAYNPIGEGLVWFAECPPIFPVTREQAVDPEFIDLTGERFGVLKVLGYGGKGRWVCICVCGRYCKRKARAIKEKVPSDDIHMCDICSNTRRIRDRGCASMMTAEAIARARGNHGGSIQ